MNQKTAPCSGTSPEQGAFLCNYPVVLFLNSSVPSVRAFPFWRILMMEIVLSHAVTSPAFREETLFLVFGSIRQRVKAQKENFAASREEYNATMVSLCAEVASAYFNLREAQQELSVLQRNALSQKAAACPHPQRLPGKASSKEC